MPFARREADPALFVRLAMPTLRLVRGGAELFRRWSDRAVGRRALARLDARQLRDIGLDPAMAAREAAKPFWRP